MVRLLVSYWYILPYKVYYLLQPGACRADLLGNPLGHNSNSIDKAPPTKLEDETQRAWAPGKGLSEHTQNSTKLKIAGLGHRPSSHL